MRDLNHARERESDRKSRQKQTDIHQLSHSQMTAPFRHNTLPIYYESSFKFNHTRNRAPMKVEHWVRARQGHTTLAWLPWMPSGVKARVVAMVMQPDLERERARQNWLVRLVQADNLEIVVWDVGHAALLCKQLVSSDHLLTLSGYYTASPVALTHNSIMYACVCAYSLFTHCTCEDWSYMAHIHIVSSFLQCVCKCEHKKRSLFRNTPV